MLALLPKITGNHSLVRELAYTARPFSAAEAEKLGLVSKVVDGGRDAVTQSALELAVVIASKSPLAVAGSKHLITHARDHPYGFIDSPPSDR
jgi:delta(3,5)-delta(2,4)-dienoyl-CoA isomerase